MDSTQLNYIYKNINWKRIPWIKDQLPDCLLDLIDREIINPCKMADLGCEIGTYNLCFAKLGYETYGFDYSHIAIDKAKELFQSHNLPDHLEKIDLSHAMNPIEHLFEFAFDYEVLHHIFPKNRTLYVENAHAHACPLLNIYPFVLVK